VSSHNDQPHHPATVVLVHGAWHGAWCWAALQAELDRRGIPSMAVDLPGHGVSTLPLTGLRGDAAHLSATLDRLDELGHANVVLVGHSYGGAVITEAAAGRSDIDHLVYVAAFALDADESVLGVLGTLDRHEVDLGAAMVPSDDGLSSTLDHDLAPPALYGSCSPEAVAAALPRLSPQPMATMTETVTGSPRDTIDSTYVVCAQDRAVHPEHQAVLAARCTHRVDLDTDHSPFVSATADLADIIAPLSIGAPA
jgi:pimeloyl-ACP methyl ester carboxylesterase